MTSACEPYLRLNELEVRAEGLNRYLNARLQENKSFTDEANPDSATNNFTTLGKRSTIWWITISPMPWPLSLRAALPATRPC